MWRPMTAAASNTGTTFARARNRANSGSYSASGTADSPPLANSSPAHDLFDVERNPVAAFAHRRPLSGVHRGVQRDD